MDRLADLQGRDVNNDRVRGTRGLAKHLDLTKYLVEDAALFFHAYGITLEVNRNGKLDLFTLTETAKVRVHKTAQQRIDLTILKDHVRYTYARDIQREDRVCTAFKPKDRG